MFRWDRQAVVLALVFVQRLVHGKHHLAPLSPRRWARTVAVCLVLGQRVTDRSRIAQELQTAMLVPLLGGALLPFDERQHASLLRRSAAALLKETSPEHQQQAAAELCAHAGHRALQRLGFVVLRLLKWTVEVNLPVYEKTREVMGSMVTSLRVPMDRAIVPSLDAVGSTQLVEKARELQNEVTQLAKVQWRRSNGRGGSAEWSTSMSGEGGAGSSWGLGSGSFPAPIGGGSGGVAGVGFMMVAGSSHRYTSATRRWGAHRKMSSPLDEEDDGDLPEEQSDESEEEGDDDDVDDDDGDEEESDEQSDNEEVELGPL